MTGSHEYDERPARKELGRFLLETGAMSPDWAEAFDVVPRSRFLPDLIWPFDPDTGESRAVDREDDPDGWFGWADTNVPITTQWDDGDHAGPELGEVFTSSSSMPSLVFSMLRALDAQPGMRVLEIGTGTGWSSALLAYRLGDASVTTVEVDPAVIAQARERLHRAGTHPAVIEGDGCLGHPPNAPYDRVIATAGLRKIPYAWIEQTRPGGIILAPWGTHYTDQDAGARLVVSGDGTRASGRFTGPMTFMKMRSQRLSWPRHAEYVPEEWADDVLVSTTGLTADAVSHGPFGVGGFVTGLAVPECAHTVHDQGNGIRAAWFYGLTDGSWAAVRFIDGSDESEVYQSGPRRLWDEVETAWRWWDGLGRPGIDRFGLTVTPEGQHTWLDRPENRIG